MKEQIREYNSFKIYLTPEDKHPAYDDIYSWTGRIFDEMNDCIYQHYFSTDDVVWGGYTVDYMFQRMYNWIDKMLEDKR